MNHCTQATLTGAGFAHLQGVRALGMCDSRANLVAAARGLSLPVNTRGRTSAGALHYTFDERGWGSEVFSSPRGPGGEPIGTLCICVLCVCIVVCKYVKSIN
jgi:hypothetical protein